MKDYSHKNTRRIRKERGMTLKELSDECGLSVSFLSKYENGKAKITVASLLQISKALDVPIRVLIATEEDDDLLVVRQDNRFPVVQNKKDKTVQEFLTRGSLFDMQVTVMNMPPFSSSGSLSAHEGEEFLFVLCGEVLLEIEGKEDVRLGCGDMAYYKSHNKHGWRNTTKRKSSFLAVTLKSGF